MGQLFLAHMLKAVRALMIKLVRRRALQPLHIRLHRFSKVGMNYWGGAEVAHSGEHHALRHAAESLRSLQRPIVFDVGANQGDFSKAVVRVFGARASVHAFEPSAAAARDLLIELGAHGCASIVEVHTFGFSSEAGTAVLHAPFNGSGIGTLHPAPFEILGSMVATEHVELRTLDAFCAAMAIDHIDYLKIDTEGHELAVLQGAKGMIESGRVRFIQFEFGECHLDSRVFFRDFHELLSPQFDIHRIIPDGLWPMLKYSPDHEVFNTANYLAIARDPHMPSTMDVPRNV